MGRRGSGRSGAGYGSGRSGSSGGFFGRSNPKPTATTQTKTASKPAAAPAPAVAPRAAPMAAPAAPAMPMAPSSGGGLLSGIGSTIVQGMAFGTGSAIAHRAVDAVAGPRVVQHEHTNAPSDGSSAAAAPSMGGCDSAKSDFDRCLSDNSGNVGACQFYFDLLNQCQRR